MTKTHSHQKKTTRNKIQTDVLDAGKTVGAIDRKQDLTVQNNAQTDMDVRDTTVGIGQQLKHRNTPKISKQSITNNSQRTVVRAEHGTTQGPRCTNSTRGNQKEQQKV